MKQCLRCGNLSDDSAEFCTNCGNSLEVREEQLESTVKSCPTCGITLDTYVEVCNNCGYRFGSNQYQPSVNQQPQPVTYRQPNAQYSRPANPVRPEPRQYNPGAFPCAAAKPQQKNNLALWLIIAVLGVMLCVTVSLLIYNMAKPERKSFGGGSGGSAGSGITTRVAGNNIIEEIPAAEPIKEKVSDYAVYASDDTWETANSAAKGMGGELVCINSEEEFGAVCSLAESYGLKVFWLGIKRPSENHLWEQTEWNDGSPFVYTCWFDAEPTYFDETGEAERYLMAFCVDGVWSFNDSVNDVSEYYSGKMGYIVETVTER